MATTRNDIMRRYERITRQMMATRAANDKARGPTIELTCYDMGNCYARSVWLNISENQKAIISFGMIPLELMVSAEQWFIQSMHAAGDCVTAVDHSDFSRGFSVGLFDMRADEGKMVA